MAVAYKNAGTFTTTMAATLDNVPLPATLNNTDIVISVGKDRGSGTLAMATGGSNSDWTEIDNVTGTVIGLRAYWARKSGGVDPSLPDWSGGTNHIYAQTFAFSGCATSGSPIDVVGTETIDESADTSIDGVSFDTASAGAMLVAIIAAGASANSGLQVYSSPAWADADASGETIREQNASTTGNDGSIALVTGDLANGPGPTGAFTMSKSESDRDVAMFFALKSASTTASGAGAAAGTGAAAATGVKIAASSGSAGGVGTATGRSPTAVAPGTASGSGAASATGMSIAAASGSAGGSGDAVAALPVDLTPTTGHLTLTGYSPAVEQGSPVISEFAFYVASGTAGTSHSATSNRFRGFVPDQGFYLSYLYRADRTTGVGVATIKARIQWYGPAGPLTSTEHTINVDADVPDYVFIESRQIAPAGAVEGEVKFIITPAASPMQHSIWIIEPRLGITQRGAEITTLVDGPSESTLFKYDYAGSAEAGQLPRSLTYKLLQGGVQVGTGVTWTYRVISGIVNGFTSADGSQSMTGTGAGSLTVSSIGSDTATVEVTATNLGITRSKVTDLLKQVGAAPSGGSGTGSIASQTSGFAASGTGGAYVTISQAGDIDFTMPAGKTQVNVVVNLTSTPPNAVGGSASRSYTSKMKVQRDIASVWTDQGSVNSQTSYAYRYSEEGVGNVYENVPASHGFTINITGLTGGSSYSIRLQQDIDDLGSGIADHTNVGSVTVVVP